MIERLAEALSRTPDAERPEDQSELRPSAVLLPLLSVQGRPSLLYTRRSSALPHHRGQVSFPGGIREEGDQSLYETALRESVEEVGVDPSRVRCLARLPVTDTLGRFRIHPFLSLWPEDDYRVQSPEEVERIFTVPLAHLLDPESRKRVSVEEEGLVFEVSAFPLEGELIWGATYRITLHFLEILRKLPRLSEYLPK